MQTRQVVDIWGSLVTDHPRAKDLEFQSFHSAWNGCSMGATKRMFISQATEHVYTRFPDSSWFLETDLQRILSQRAFPDNSWFPDMGLRRKQMQTKQVADIRGFPSHRQSTSQGSRISELSLSQSPDFDWWNSWLRKEVPRCLDSESLALQSFRTGTGRSGASADWQSPLIF